MVSHSGEVTNRTRAGSSRPKLRTRLTGTSLLPGRDGRRFGLGRMSISEGSPPGTLADMSAVDAAAPEETPAVRARYRDVLGRSEFRPTLGPNIGPRLGPWIAR